MGKSKIVILTLYYKNYNYGGILQAYALQRVLNLLGYDASQISYRLETGKDNWNPVKAGIKKPLACIYHFIMFGDWYRNYNYRRKKLISLLVKYLILKQLQLPLLSNYQLFMITLFVEVIRYGILWGGNQCSFLIFCRKVRRGLPMRRAFLARN